MGVGPREGGGVSDVSRRLTLMRASVERVRGLLAAPQVFEVVALASCVLLVVLEANTPWNVTYTPIGEGSFVVEGTTRPLWGLLGSVLLVLAPLAALRSMWLGALLVVPRLAMGVAAGLAWPWTAYAALTAVAVCGAWRRPRLAWVVAAAALVEPAVAIWFGGKMMTPGGSVEFGMFGQTTAALVFTTIFYAVATALMMLLPVLLRREAGRERDLRDLLRGRRDVQREAAVLDERSRLARDLHDVVAHHVSLIAVRAETAPYTYPDLSPDARAAFAEIADESRLALRELRGVLGVLRRTTDAAPRTPQPTAARIEQLVLDAQSTNATVTASLRDLEEVSPAVGYVAYRVVQEALTNARRHAPDAAVDVTARGTGGGGISVRVANAVPQADAAWEHGQGITGMTERVAAAGGHVEVNSHDGLFVVEAYVPESSSAEPDQEVGVRA